MSSYQTNGCTPANPGPAVIEILLNPVTGVGVTSIRVFKLSTSVQGTVSSNRANIYLNDTAFYGFREHIKNNPQTTVTFDPQPIVPPPFTWG